MAVGHHYIPQAVKRILAQYLSATALSVFSQGVTGNPNVLDHGNKQYGPLTHNQYNEIIEGLTRRHIEQLRQNKQLLNGKMTGAQARSWLEQIKRNGAGNPRVVGFNQAVLQSLKLASLAGILANSMLSDANAVLHAMKETPYFRNAHAALLRGDLGTAHKNLVGEGFDKSLYTELLKRNARAASAFKDQWLKAECRERTLVTRRWRGLDVEHVRRD